MTRTEWPVLMTEKSRQLCPMWRSAPSPISSIKLPIPKLIFRKSRSLLRPTAIFVDCQLQQVRMDRDDVLYLRSEQYLNLRDKLYGPINKFPVGKTQTTITAITGSVFAREGPDIVGPCGLRPRQELEIIIGQVLVLDS